MRSIILHLVIVLFVSGCISTPTESPTPKEAPTIIALPTASATPIPTHPPTGIAAPTPTLTQSPYSILISRTFYAGDGVGEIYSCVVGLNTYRFVLYQNGYLVINGTQETVLSQSEIDRLLSEIEATGFFSLNEDHDAYISTPSPNDWNQWTWGSDIVVKEKRINLKSGFFNDEVEAIKKTKHLIDDFQPLNLKPYQPESIWLWVVAIDKDAPINPYYPAPFPPVLHWKSEAIQLDEIAAVSGKVISGNSLTFIMQQIKGLPDYHMIEQGGQNYLVAACPNFK